MKAAKPNRLIHEKSPYLLQHAYNPVEWFPWGPEAFAKAHQENKPIFLSIGYSTCHWCHVMERESFEDEGIAKILNEHFISIKVDREERPDLDSIHMTVVMTLTGSGGWPMSVFLTPDKKPFYGGTYFPPTPRWGSPGFRDLLLSINNNWQAQEKKIHESGESIVNALRQRSAQSAASSAKDLSSDIIKNAYQELKSNFDPDNGGFGRAPKFPMGHTLSFLLRYWKNADEREALAMVEKTLLRMASGGIYDQVGGGFHRYSTDAIWQVPHFEKMLYDQALLSKAYLEVYQATGNSFYGQIARETLDYVLRDMHDHQGGFFSAEDADSLEPGVPEASEKKEGAFYIWSQEELENILTAEEYKAVVHYFDIHPNGNAEVDPHGEFVGKNILHIKKDMKDSAQHNLLAAAKEKLFEQRKKRPRPYLDDKILVDWNGLMISSFALAGRILEDGHYLQAAEAAAQFILQKIRRKDGRLLHRFRDGEAAFLAGLEDYAFFIQALLDLYENSFNPEYFTEAVRLNKEMMELFWDSSGTSGGFFATPVDGEELFFRPKEVYDGAVPSGNSVAALNLSRLYHFTPTPALSTGAGSEFRPTEKRRNFEMNYLQIAESLFKAFYSEVSQRPSAYSQMLMALQFYFGPVKEIVVAGATDKGQGKEMLNLIYSTFLPQRVLIVKSPNVSKRIENLLPFTKEQVPLGKDTAVYVCEKQTCQKPVKDVQNLKLAL